MRKLYRNSMYLVIHLKDKTFTLDDVGGLHYDDVYIDENISTFDRFDDFVNFLAHHGDSFPHTTYKWFGKKKCRITDYFNCGSTVFNAEDFISADYHVLSNPKDDDRYTFEFLSKSLAAPDFINYCKDRGLNVCPLK